jgi:hypothetical protein
MATMKLMLDWMAAIGALIAGLLWIQSARVKVLASQTENEKGADGTFPARITVSGGDFIATAIEQARWNQKAAFAAALAAFFQAVGMMIPS